MVCAMSRLDEVEMSTWIDGMSRDELLCAIESTGAMCARLYARGASTVEVDARLDLLMSAFDARESQVQR
jgi:hypothetical protein